MKGCIEFEVFDTLNCPECGGENLHQESYTSFWREQEDSGIGTIRTDERGLIVKNERGMKDNHSPRRDGLLILFSCETCSRYPELAIYQHKGSTFMAWKSTIK